MKLIKHIFLVLAGLIIAFCLIIVICALNPALTQRLAAQVSNLRPGSASSGNQVILTEEQARGTGVLPEGTEGINVDWLPNRETAGYLIPEAMPENLPAEVWGRWGYIPVSSEAEQVLQDEVYNLDDLLTDVDLEVESLFPEIYYPYYAMLEPELKLIYFQIYSNAMVTNPSFVLASEANLQEVETAFEALFNDHPELTDMNTSYSCLYLEDGTVVEIRLDYNELSNDLDRLLEMLSHEEDIVREASRFSTDFEKVKYIHDYLAETVEYDLNAPMNQVAYSAMMNRRTVCAGYARAFQLLMQKMDIPCYYCTGFAGEDHAWNIVLLDGKYYNIDVTWDDMETISYDYFNKTDAEFADTHVRTGLSVYLPACTGTYYGAEALARLEESSSMTAEDADMADSQETEEDTASAETSWPQLQAPLTWTGRGDLGNWEPEEQKPQEDQIAATYGGETVLDTMEKYYDDCEAQMKEVGTGDQHFSNVIPSSLWGSVESAYSSGAYKSGYVTDALKELKAENFSVQIQVVDIGGGYYRVYHNIYTY